jgi:hypothetical protein
MVMADIFTELLIYSSYKDSIKSSEPKQTFDVVLSPTNIQEKVYKKVVKKLAWDSKGKKRYVYS